MLDNMKTHLLRRKPEQVSILYHNGHGCTKRLTDVLDDGIVLADHNEVIMVPFTALQSIRWSDAPSTPRPR